MYISLPVCSVVLNGELMKSNPVIQSNDCYYAIPPPVSALSLAFWEAKVPMVILALFGLALMLIAII